MKSIYAEQYRQIELKIAFYRKLRGLTQEELAELSGLSYKFYQHLESGRKRLVRIDTIERICSGYKIELWEFFYNKNSVLRKVRMHRFIKFAAKGEKRGRSKIIIC